MTDKQPPTISTRGNVHAPTAKGTRIAGKWGVVPERGCLGYVTKRDSHAHRIRSLDAYAISTSVLRNLERLKVGRVFIHETDTGDVYEYLLEDFTEYGRIVPGHILEDDTDPQRFHSRDDPAALWPKHAGLFYNHRDTDAVDAEFTTAADLEAGR